MTHTTPTATTPAPAPLLWTAEQCAAACSVCRASWFSMQAAGAIPAPVLARGHIRRWAADEIAEWCKAGCPSRERWEQIRGARR